MSDYGIKLHLLSAQEYKKLQELNVELSSVGLEFKRLLSPIQMLIVGRIVADLHYRTNNEDSLVNFAVGDWLVEATDNCGLDEDKAAQIMLGLMSAPTLFNSCFISYSHKDELFATQLYSRLKEARVPVWYAPEDIRGGKKLYEQIDDAIHKYQRLMIVLSDNSLQSEWVITEIRKARKAEIKDNQRKLFPIRLIDMKKLQEWECFDADSGKDLAVEIREYYIPDFSDWENTESFQKNFAKLLDDLKIPLTNNKADQI